MKIVADRAIPFVEEFFSSLGEAVLLDGARITPAAVAGADCLVVRSVTRVGAELLAGSRVRCVATATAGADHIDQDYLRTRDIPLLDAKGSNARAVAEYVLCCLFTLAGQGGLNLPAAVVGVIGCGNVGGRLRRLLGALGIRVLAYDPYLRDARGRLVFQELDEVLTANVITLHVPLTHGGEHPTARLVRRRFLDRLRKDVVLINTSRGAVADEQDLADFARRHDRARLVLDVWDNEPHINGELLAAATLATPHIAGYSFQGRVNATRSLYEQVCAWAGVRPAAPTAATTFPGEDASLELSGSESVITAAARAALACCDPGADCATLREIGRIAAAERGAFFTALRANYPPRREFAALRVALPTAAHTLRERLSRLGFALAR